MIIIIVIIALALASRPTQQQPPQQQPKLVSTLAANVYTWLRNPRESEREGEVEVEEIFSLWVGVAHQLPKYLRDDADLQFELGYGVWGWGWGPSHAVCRRLTNATANKDAVGGAFLWAFLLKINLCDNSSYWRLQFPSSPASMNM